MKRLKIILGALACLLMLWSCAGSVNTGEEGSGGTEQSVQEVVRISPAQLKAMLSDPELLIIDLRISQHWHRSDAKIPGAKRFDPQDVQSWAQDLDRDKKIVTYCA